jgi:biotin carboxyl carrier protein
VELEFSIAQKNHSLTIQKKNEHYQVKIGDQNIELKAVTVTPNCVMLTDEQGTQRFCIASTTEKTYVHFKGRQYVIDHSKPKEKTSFGGDDQLLGIDKGICAPMPGKILKILVQENQKVAPKQNLVIVEAMKMEHNIRAPRNGTVKMINFKEGDLVDTGQEILEIEYDAENKNDS